MRVGAWRGLRAEFGDFGPRGSRGNQKYFLEVISNRLALAVACGAGPVEGDVEGRDDRLRDRGGCFGSAAGAGEFYCHGNGARYFRFDMELVEQDPKDEYHAAYELVEEFQTGRIRPR